MGKNPCPDNVDWMAIADAARRNSSRLLNDAKLLLANGSPALTYSVAILGLEELGKYYMCLSVPAGLNDPTRVWRKLDLHGPKLEQVASAVALFGHSFLSADIVAQWEEFVARESRTKMRGMYVDWDGDHVAEPKDVPISAAREVVGLLRDLVAFVNTHDLALMAPNLAEVNIEDFMREVASSMGQLDEHLKTLPADEADALKRKLVDDVVAMAREVIAPDVVKRDEEIAE